MPVFETVDPFAGRDWRLLLASKTDLTASGVYQNDTSGAAQDAFDINARLTSVSGVTYSDKKFDAVRILGQVDGSITGVAGIELIFTLGNSLPSNDTAFTAQINRTTVRTHDYNGTQIAPVDTTIVLPSRFDFVAMRIDPSAADVTNCNFRMWVRQARLF